MNTAIAYDPIVLALFQARFNKCLDTPKLPITAAVGTVEHWFGELKKHVKQVGTIVAGDLLGQTRMYQYIYINTKVGAFMFYLGEDKVVRYITEQSYSTCTSAALAGFGKTTGVIENEDMMQHILAVVNSYQ